MTHARDLPWAIYTGKLSPFPKGITAYAAYKHGKALFIANQHWSQLSPWWEVFIVGHPHTQIGAPTLEQAQDVAELWAAKLEKTPPEPGKFMSFKHLKESR